MEKFEYHHWVPLVIGGFECEENTMHLSQSMHMHVHKVCNIPFKKIRAFRCKYNHMIIPTMEYCEDMCQLQRLYFANFDHLSLFAKKAHMEAIVRLNRYTMTLYGITWNNYRERDPSFKYHLDVYHATITKAYQKAL